MFENRRVKQMCNEQTDLSAFLKKLSAVCGLSQFGRISDSMRELVREKLKVLLSEQPPSLKGDMQELDDLAQGFLRDIISEKERELVVAALAPLTTNDVEEIRKISSLSRHSGRIVRKKVSELINPLVAQGQLEEAVDIILKIGNIESVHWEPIWQATGKLESSLSSCQRIQKLKSKIGDRYSAEELLRELNKQLAGKILEIINDDKLSNAELADIYELTPERLRRQVEAKIIERWEKYLDDTAFLRKIWVIDPEFGKVLVNFKTGAMMTKVLASLPPKE